MANWPQVSVDMEKEREMCFVCGQANPIGLRLSFRWDGRVARAEFTPSRLYQGWARIVHGGIIACLLDEAMSYAALFSGASTVTARMEARFKRPAPIDKPLIITGFLTKKTRKLVEARAEVALSDGTVVAEGAAKMFVLAQKQEE